MTAACQPVPEPRATSRESAIGPSPCVSAAADVAHDRLPGSGRHPETLPGCVCGAPYSGWWTPLRAAETAKPARADPDRLRESRRREGYFSTRRVAKRRLMPTVASPAMPRMPRMASMLPFDGAALGGRGDRARRRAWSRSRHRCRRPVEGGVDDGQELEGRDAIAAREGADREDGVGGAGRKRQGLGVDCVGAGEGITAADADLEVVRVGGQREVAGRLREREAVDAEVAHRPRSGRRRRACRPRSGRRGPGPSRRRSPVRRRSAVA